MVIMSQDKYPEIRLFRLHKRKYDRLKPCCSRCARYDALFPGTSLAEAGLLESFIFTILF